MLHEMERVCIEVARDLGHARVVASGSHVFGSVLPGISDVDALVQLTKPVGAVSIVQFQQQVAARLLSYFAAAKVRLRVAGAGSAPLPILTSKLWSNAPVEDLLVAVLGPDGEPSDEASMIAHGSLRDSPWTLAMVEEAASSPRDRKKIIEIFCGALRFVKLWPGGNTCTEQVRGTLAVVVGRHFLLAFCSTWSSQAS